MEKPVVTRIFTLGTPPGLPSKPALETEHDSPLPGTQVRTPGDHTATTGSPPAALSAGETVDIFQSGFDDPACRVMLDLARVGSFVSNVGDRGLSPRKLFDSLALLRLIEVEQLENGRGIVDLTGLRYRFQRQYGREPSADPRGVVESAKAVNWATRDFEVRLTEDGSRILADMARLMQDWLGYHTRDRTAQTIYLAERELEKMRSYDDVGFRSNSLARSLYFLLDLARQIDDRQYEFIEEGLALGKVEELWRRYEEVLAAIDSRRRAGMDIPLPLQDRIMNSRVDSIRVGFQSLANISNHAANRGLAHTNLINSEKFVAWVVENFSGGDTGELTGGAHGLMMPLRVPFTLGATQAAEFVDEMLGREFEPPEGGMEEQMTTSGVVEVVDVSEKFGRGTQVHLDGVIEATAGGAVRLSELLTWAGSWYNRLKTMFAAAVLTGRDVLDYELLPSGYLADDFELPRDALVMRTDETGRRDSGDIRT